MCSLLDLIQVQPILANQYNKMQLCLPTTRLVVLAVTVVFSGGTVAAASTSEKKTDTAAARIASVKAQPSAVFLRGVAATAIHAPPPPRQLEEERTCTSVSTF